MPLSANEFEGFCNIDVFPSPKSQNTSGVLPSDVKFMLNGGEVHKVVSGGTVAVAVETVVIKLKVSTTVSLMLHVRSHAITCIGYIPSME